MKTQEQSQEQDKINKLQDWHEYRHPAAGRVLGGIVLVGIGVVLFLEKMGYFFPDWVFTWKMLLVAIGVYVGARHLFRGFGWLIPIIIGLLFLADDFIPGFKIRPFIWPIVIVIIGLFMIFRPKHMHRHQWRRHWRHQGRTGHHRFNPSYQGFGHHGFSQHQGGECGHFDKQFGNTTSSEDRLEEVYVFSGTKKNVISKDFKGGEVTCVFGGAEINLSQADIHGKVQLELNQVFGSTKLIVPPHWQVNVETVAFMGGIEDRRPETNVTDPEKILILKGISVFGGIDISSY
jgi:predicted membrane protein